MELHLRFECGSWSCRLLIPCWDGPGCRRWPSGWPLGLEEEWAGGRSGAGIRSRRPCSSHGRVRPRGDPLENSVDVSVDISGSRSSGTVVQDQLAYEAIGLDIVDQLLDLGILVGGHQGDKGADKQLGYSGITH